MVNVYFDPVKHEYTVGNTVVPSVTEICGLLKKYDNVNPSILAVASARGTAVHELTEKIDYGEVEEYPMELDGYVIAYQKFLNDYRPNWLFIEKIMGDEYDKLGGTVDRVGYIDDKLVIVDIKTISSFDRIAKLSLGCQLSGYYWLLNDLGIENVDLNSSFGLWLKKDGTYDIIKYSEIADNLKEHETPMDLFVTLKKIIEEIK